LRISVEVLIGMAVIVAAALAAFAAYQWRQRQRVHGVEERVRDLLLARYGEPPPQLTINCTDDRRWPVLVGFKHPTTGVPHRLQFARHGGPATLALLSEEEGD
jgi:hypothetical protein